MAGSAKGRGALGWLRHGLGLALAAGLTWTFWYAWTGYGQFANVARWTGEPDLNWLRPWLTEFRAIVLCVTGFLTLSAVSWLWRLLRLGH